MKLLVDMNLSPRWVELLNEAGFGAVHWSAVGPYDALDAEIMNFAVANGYTILTHDLDFGAILAASGGSKPSVVQIRAADLSPDALGPTIILGLRQVADQLEQGALLSIDPKGRRLRILPLR